MSGVDVIIYGRKSGPQASPIKLLKSTPRPDRERGRPAKIWIKLLIVLTLVVAIGAGLFVAHRFQKKRAISEAREAGLEAYQNHQYNIAARELGRYLAAVDDDIEVQLLYAHALLQRRPRAEAFIQNAISVYETILRRQKGHVEASDHLSRLYLMYGRPIEAERVTRSWKEAQPSSGEAWHRFITAMLAQKKPEKTAEAVLAAREQLERRSDDALMWLGYAEALLQQGELEEAILVLASKVLDQHGDIDEAAVHDEHGVRAAILLAGLYAGQVSELSVNPSEDDARKGALIRSEKLLRQLTEVRPNDPAPFLAKARFHLEHQWPGPAADGPNAQGSADTQPVYWPQLVEEYLNQASACPTEEIKPLLEIGRVWIVVGDTRRAGELFLRAAGLAPYSSEPYVVWFESLMQLGLLADADRVADKALAADLGEMRADLLLPAVEMYYAAERPEDAVKCFEELRDQKPPSAILSYVEGLRALHEGSPESAAQKFTDAVKLSPDLVQCWLFLARTARSMNDLKRAEDMYREYLRQEPAPLARLRPQLELARLLSDQGRHSDALAMVERTVPAVPPALMAEAIMVSVDLRVGAAEAGTIHAADPAFLAGVTRDARKLLELMPEDQIARSLLARSLTLQGHLDQAATLLTDPGIPEDQRTPHRVLLADLYTRNERYPEALEAYRQALGATTDPSRRSTLQFRLVRLHALLHQDELAVSLIEQIVAESGQPAPSVLLLEAATLLSGMQRDARAAELLIELVTREPDRLEAWLMLFSLPPNAQDRYARPEIIKRLREIEGEDGLQWRLMQAMLWLQDEDWQRHRPEIEEALNTCLAGRPEWVDALLTMAQLQEKTGRQNRALETYRRAWHASGRQSGMVARNALPLATREQSWTEVREFLSILPENDLTLNRYRIVLMAQTDPASADRALGDLIRNDPDDWRSRLMLAEMKRRQGSMAQADQLLAEAAGIAPAEPEVLKARVASLIDDQDMDQLIDICTQAIEEHSMTEAFALRASAYSAKGDLEKARTDLETVAATKGWEERGYLGLGQFFIKHGKTQEALQCWAKGLEVLPDSFALRKAMAELLLQGDASQQKKGVELLDVLMVDYPANEDIRLLEARFLEAQEPQKAEAIYMALLEKIPDSTVAVRRLAVLASRRGDRETALRYIRQALESASQNVDLLIMQAELNARDEPLLARSVASQAAQAARGMLDTQPNNEAAAIALARALKLAGKQDDAIRALQDFLKERTEAGPALQAQLTLMDLLIRAGRLSDAEEALPELMKAGPSDPQTIKAAMELRAAQERWDDITKLADQFLRQHPDQTTIVLSAVEYLLSAPDQAYRNQAVARVRALAEQHDADPEVLNMLGRAEYQFGHFQEAEAAFRKGLAADPSNVDLINNLAWVLCEVKNAPAEASTLAKHFIDTAQADPAYPHLLDTWGTIQMRLGNLDAAGKAFQRCREDSRTAPATRATATVRLARALAPSHAAQSRRLLEELRTAGWELLSPAEQQEAERFLSELKESL